MNMPNKSQTDRFKEAAREVGADESPDAMDRIMGKLDLTKKPERVVHDASTDLPDDGQRKKGGPGGK